VSAQRAAREITAQLGGQAPWVRRVDAVQREIRAGRSR
jgi:septal ring-binding cell division protein DamX